MDDPRTPKPKQSLPCFGLEFDRSDALCQGCKLFAPCAQASRSRDGLVRLDKSVVQLTIPSGTAQGVEDDISNFFALEMELVLHQRPKPLGRAIQNQVRQVAARMLMEPQLYIAAAVAGHAALSPDRPINGHTLVGPITQQRVELYREECSRRRGFLDARGLTSVSGHAGSDVLTRLTDSETLACAYVVGHRLRVGKNALQSLYLDRELALDPLWLATEPTYWRWLDDSPATTRMLTRWRAQARQARHWVAALIGLRNRVVLPALNNALCPHGIAAHDLMGPGTITQVAPIWVGLAEALGRLEAMSILDGLVEPKTQGALRF